MESKSSVREIIIKCLNEYLNRDNKEFIAYHSTDFKIDEFDFDKVELKANSSTRIDGMFFSNVPQNSWGNYVYKVKIISKNPAVFDLSTSRFDSLSIQEAFDALLRQDGAYLIEDLVDYGDMEQSDAESLIDKWYDLDLIIIKNEVYGSHDIEYIVPASYYNGKSAKIINLGLNN